MRDCEMKDQDGKKTIIGVGLLIAVLLLTGAGAYAADSGNGWKTDVTPYAWLAGVNGDITINGLSAHISESFSDIPDVLDFGGMLVVESTKDRAAILFDTAYVKLSDSRASTSLNMTESVTELAGAYTAIVPESTGLALDVLAGIRFWYVKNEVGILGLGQAGSHDWLDQFLGARARWALMKNLRLVLRGDVGGFGVESKWSWNAIGTIQYGFSDRFSAVAGYRALYGHYELGDSYNKFEYSASLAGPIIGASFRL
jgi:hypothetical protein